MDPKAAAKAAAVTGRGSRSADSGMINDTSQQKDILCEPSLPLAPLEPVILRPTCCIRRFQVGHKHAEFDRMSNLEGFPLREIQSAIATVGTCYDGPEPKSKRFRVSRVSRRLRT
jgi:hypothetical protein